MRKPNLPTLRISAANGGRLAEGLFDQLFSGPCSTCQCSRRTVHVEISAIASAPPMGQSGFRLNRAAAISRGWLCRLLVEVIRPAFKFRIYLLQVPAFPASCNRRETVTVSGTGPIRWPHTAIVLTTGKGSRDGGAPNFGLLCDSVDFPVWHATVESQTSLLLQKVPTLGC